MDQMSTGMLSAERRSLILEELAQSGAVQVSTLADRFEVDPATIRRDLNRLEGEGYLHRVHGGAVLRDAAPVTSTATGLERRIAETAARFIPNDSVLFLGPGVLTREVVPFLAEKEQLTIVTNALDVAWNSVHSGSHTLHLLGGQVGEDYGIYGSLEPFSHLRADHVVLEAGGLDAGRGLTHDQVYYADIARTLFNLGAQIIVLLPPERVGRVAAVFISPAEEVDVLVTGREATNAPLWDLSELGIRIVLT